jgi:rubrerythrin
MEKRFADILDLAIKREEEAYDFYLAMLAKVVDSSVRDTLEFIADEEKKHRAFLLGYRKGDLGPDAMRMADAVDYRIAEYLDEPETADQMSAEDVFLIASHRELRSFKFYSELAGLHNDGDIRSMLLKMANEELKHKEKMEYLYTNTAYPQTSGG